MMNELMNGMLGKIAPGMCRLSMQGGIAVKTSSGYKTYDDATGRMINCHNFVFPDGEDFFFVIPTNKVRKSDIILRNGKPSYVLEACRDTIKVLNYENGVIETVLPERYLFMGNTYFYGKIVSIFGTDGLRSRKGPGKIMKYMMLSQMLKGKRKKSVLPMMLLMGKGDISLDSLFDEKETDEEDSNEDIES